MYSCLSKWKTELCCKKREDEKRASKRNNFVFRQMSASLEELFYSQWNSEFGIQNCFSIVFWRDNKSQKPSFRSVAIAARPKPQRLHYKLHVFRVYQKPHFVFGRAVFCVFQGYSICIHFSITFFLAYHLSVYHLSVESFLMRRRIFFIKKNFFFGF